MHDNMLNEKSPIAGEKWPKLKLTPQQALRWDENRAAFVWAVSSFSDIWLGMMADKNGDLAHFTDQIETAATDDKLLYINPTFYFKLTLDEALFVDSHEVEHAMYGHAGLMYMLNKEGFILYNDGVKLPFKHKLMNAAMDYVINDQLVKGKIGRMPEGGLHWPAKITGDMSVLDAYRILWEENEKRPCTQGSDAPNPGVMRSTDERGNDKGAGSGKSFDELIEPGKAQGKSANKAMSERNQPEWDVTIQAAMEGAKLRGQLPGNLERIFAKKLQPKADWREVYNVAVSKKIGNDRYSWDRLDQQLIWRGIGAPGRTNRGCNLVIIVRDSSGSINDRTTAVWGAETRQVLEDARPKRVIIVDCDAAVHRWEEIDDYEALEDKVIGGWGTSFVPVFERVEAEGEEPDLLIYLTDLDGEFPLTPPSYPVVWGCIDPNAKKPPFGEVVMVPAQAEEMV